MLKDWFFKTFSNEDKIYWWVRWFVELPKDIKHPRSLFRKTIMWITFWRRDKFSRWLYQKYGCIHRCGQVVGGTVICSDCGKKGASTIAAYII